MLRKSTNAEFIIKHLTFVSMETSLKFIIKQGSLKKTFGVLKISFLDYILKNTLFLLWLVWI